MHSSRWSTEDILSSISGNFLSYNVVSGKFLFKLYRSFVHITWLLVLWPRKGRQASVCYRLPANIYTLEWLQAEDCFYDCEYVRIMFSVSYHKHYNDESPHLTLLNQTVSQGISMPRYNVDIPFSMFSGSLSLLVLNLLQKGLTTHNSTHWMGCGIGSKQTSSLSLVQKECHDHRNLKLSLKFKRRKGKVHTWGYLKELCPAARTTSVVLGKKHDHK